MKERLKGLWQLITGIGGLVIVLLFVMAFFGAFDDEAEEIGNAKIFRGNDTKSVFSGEATIEVTKEEKGQEVKKESESDDDMQVNNSGIKYTEEETGNIVEENSDDSISAIVAGEYISTSADTNAIITITDDGYMGISSVGEMYDFDRAELIDNGDETYQASGCEIVYTVTFYEDGLFLYNDEADFLIGFFERVD